MPLKQTASLRQPQFSVLIRELRGAIHLTQGQLATQIGVNYVTVSRWETGRIQPSELALRQVQTFLETLCQSAEPSIQGRSKALLHHYFVPTESS